MEGLKRGAFIVIEGVDRSGKSTQCKKLVEKLVSKNIKAEYANFPDRTTEIGKIINSYLSSKKDLSDEAIHLLFSANRWECANHIKQKLQSGITMIVDRYSYSGVAFSAAKGLDISWCKAPEKGLPNPDRVFLLTMPTSSIVNRDGFGNERYEVPEFQEKVMKIFISLEEQSWDVINADRSINCLHSELLEKVLKIIMDVKDKPITKLWTNE